VKKLGEIQNTFTRYLRGKASSLNAKYERKPISKRSFICLHKRIHASVKIPLHGIHFSDHSA
jgi:hypothetical protein